MLSVTFYSFKGGLGRTMALLDVAVILARAGLRVVALDMDLEAPGFHQHESLGLPPDALGLADFALARLEGPELSILPFVHPAAVPRTEGRLHIMPAGIRPERLADRLPQIYREPLTDDALVFQVVMGRIETEIAPDLLLIDSRTGLAESSGISTVEMADLIVAMTSLNPQSTRGLAEVIGRIRTHPARAQPPGFILAYGPIPRGKDLDLPGLETAVRSVTEPEIKTNPLWTRVVEAKRTLEAEAAFEFGDLLREVQTLFPLLRESDLQHWLPYDPWAHLLGDADFDRPGPLRSAHIALADVIARAAGQDLKLVDRTPFGREQIGYLLNPLKRPDDHA